MRPRPPSRKHRAAPPEAERHVCPVGFVIARLGRLGQRLGLARSTPPRLEAGLRLPKYLFLLFFLYTTFFGMGLSEVESFLRSPYNLTADARMLQFFLSPGPVAVAVLTGLAVLGLVFRGSFCRWVCPYGALLGLLAKIGPTALTRDAAGCTGCGRCRKACPMDLPITAGARPMECSGCASCVVTCPRPESAVRFSFAGRIAPWWLPLVGACGVFALTYLAANALGLWNAKLPTAMIVSRKAWVGACSEIASEHRPERPRSSRCRSTPAVEIVMRRLEKSKPWGWCRASRVCTRFS